MPKQQKYAVGTTISKVFIDPNTQQPRIYSGEIISHNGTKKNKQYRVKYFDDGDIEDIGVRELSKIVDEGGSDRDLAAKEDSSSELLLDDDLDGRSSEEEYEHATQKKRRNKTVRKGRSSSSGNAKLEAIGVTTDHQHQDGSPMQQPPSGRKKRKQQVKKKRKSFAQRIKDLKAYKEKNGHVNVKKSLGKSLYIFCKHMRQARNNPEKSTVTLTDDRMASLDALGFDWGSNKKQITFEQRMNDLRAYKEKHGHVDLKEREDKSLYLFCKNMRRAHDNPEKSAVALTDDRIASLDALGFGWSGSLREQAAKNSFALRIEDLRAYKGKHGHVNVKQSEDKSLYEFFRKIRQARNNPGKSNAIINDEQIASLDDLGFEWRAIERGAKKSFAQRIEDLKAYKEKYGHVNIKKCDKSLYYFCGNIRQARNNPEKSNRAINDDRIASLDALGFDWTVRERGTKSFEQRLEDLRAYKEKHGHINVRKSDDTSLYKFCKHMRNNRTNLRQARKHPEKSTVALTDERIARLDALGFDWSMNSGIKSLSQQTDQPPSKRKSKQKGQGKVGTATKKKHVSPKWSAKNDKGWAASSDQMEASVTSKDEAALSDPIPSLGHSGNDVPAASPLEVSTTNAILDPIDLTTDVETESVNKHTKSFASILLEEKGKRLVQVKQEMTETQDDLKDMREDLDIANDTVTQQAVFTNAWQNKFEELAKLAEAGRVDGAKILEIRNRSIITR